MVFNCRWKTCFGRPQCKKRAAYLGACFLAIGGSVLIFFACMQYLIGAFNVHYEMCTVNDKQVERFSSQYGSYWYSIYSVNVLQTTITNRTATTINGYNTKTHATEELNKFEISNGTFAISYPCIYTSRARLTFPKAVGIGNLKEMWIGQDAVDFAKAAKFKFYVYLMSGTVLMIGVILTCGWASFSGDCCSENYRDETDSVDLEESSENDQPE